ncbi:HypC/HybG/HupF family hydrogenase formation chaperone [Abyssisolibacter fermentans]|uniref:HypC/HybG/HupF family hydrogenase formation chaperone n=1 Tax=Abyssisolibacter fermentans TaxID=1766203 RepID=UPI00082B3320|nr:HypC/HybG/HupF family hydrogenase formation chaperone [Abyssisolibacter fermentans]
MCIAVPAEVVKVYESEALVCFGGVKTKVNTYFLENLKVGDYVLIHVGCALQKIDKNEAVKTLEIFKDISNYR